ncbi:hypothetical protein F5877DRAFT_66454 [Lentinula edodes]|nr:hypothetical protein F5877DRAFT_66454 [Lentinula edodes]
MTQAQKSNQAASSTAITVVAGQRLMSIPEQLFRDKPSNDIRTPEEHQPVAWEPPSVDPGPTGTAMGPPQWRYASMGYAQPASSPMGGFTYSPTWGARGPPPGPASQLDMESALNAGGRSRTLSRRLLTPPIQSVNPPLRRRSSLSSLLKSPAVNTPNWEGTYAIHHSRTNFPVQPSSEMMLRLEDFIRTQECTPEDVAMVLQEVLELIGIEILGNSIEFSNLQVRFLTVGTQLEIDLLEKAQQWLMTLTNRSDFLWLYNVLWTPSGCYNCWKQRFIMDNHSETRGGYSPSFLRPMEEKEKSALRPGYIYCTKQQTTYDSNPPCRESTS